MNVLKRLNLTAVSIAILASVTTISVAWIISRNNQVVKMDENNVASGDDKISEYEQQGNSNTITDIDIAEQRIGQLSSVKYTNGAVDILCTVRVGYICDLKGYQQINAEKLDLIKKWSEGITEDSGDSYFHVVRWSFKKGELSSYTSFVLITYDVNDIEVARTSPTAIGK